ncbi:MAG TPA: hypothetical protein VF817_01335 [Patescibacteria group bacterium]
MAAKRNKKSNKRAPCSITETDYPILVKKFGKKKADQMVLLAVANNKEARQRIGADEPETAASA